MSNKFKLVWLSLIIGFSTAIALVIGLLFTFKNESKAHAEEKYYPTTYFKTPAATVYKFSDNENNVDCYVTDSYRSSANIACVRKKNKE